MVENFDFVTPLAQHNSIHTCLLLYIFGQMYVSTLHFGARGFTGWTMIQQLQRPPGGCRTHSAKIFTFSRACVENPLRNCLLLNMLCTNYLTCQHVFRIVEELGFIL